MKLIMQHPNTGVIKKVGVGFSWLIFAGPGWSLFWGDAKGCLLGSFLSIISLGLSQLFYWPRVYNKRRTVQLLEKGFKVKEVQGGTIEEAREKLGIALPVLES